MSMRLSLSRPLCGLILAIQLCSQTPAQAPSSPDAADSNPQSVPGMYRLGDALIKEKRYTAAIAILRQAMERAPDNLEIQVALAEALYGNGAAAEALQMLISAAASHPKSAFAQSSLGVLYAREKRYDHAIECFHAALAIDPVDNETRVSLAKAEFGLFHYPETIAAADVVIRTQPRDYEARYLRGAAYRASGDFEKAANDLRVAVEINPKYYPAQFSLGSVLAKLNQLEQARVHLTKACELAPDAEEARFQLAMVLRRLNQGDAARRELSEFEQRRRRGEMENLASTTATHANESLLKGDAKAAAEGYREALKVDPDNAKTYYNLALAQLKLNDRTGAIGSLEKSVSLDGKAAPVRSQLGLLYMGEQRDNDAEKQFRAGLEADPQCAECQNNLGVLYGQRGDPQRAEQFFRQAIENSASYNQARLNLALILAGRQDYADARHELEIVLKTEPNDLKALTARGMVESRTGDGDAMETFRKVVALDGQSFEARLNFGIALADRGRSEEALGEFSEAVKLAPDRAGPHYNKGRVLVQLHRYEEALPELQRTCALDSASPDAWYRLGIARRELKQYSEAVSALRKALELAPENADASYLLGQSYQSLGKMNDAIAAWKDTLKADPNNQQALYSLVRALAKQDPAEAARYQATLESLKTQRSNNEQAETLSNFAIAAAKANKWDDAIVQLRQAIQICGDCSSLAQLHKNLGLIQCQAGRFADCGTELRVALGKMPGDPEILKALEILKSMGPAAR